MNGYKLTRNWFDFRHENASRCRAIHTELYMYIIDRWNRYGQSKEFTLPTSSTMGTLGIGSYNTYKKAFNDLVDFGFIKVIRDPKNQQGCKVIALSKTDKATDKALDKANAKATDEAGDEAPDKATDTLIEQLNKGTIEQLNKGIKEQTNPHSSEDIPKFDFKSNLLLRSKNEDLVEDWILVRKEKKHTNTKTAFEKFLKEVQLSGKDINEVLEICIERSWAYFEHTYLKKEDAPKLYEPEYRQYIELFNKVSNTNHLVSMWINQSYSDFERWYLKCNKRLDVLLNACQGAIRKMRQTQYYRDNDYVDITPASVLWEKNFAKFSPHFINPKHKFIPLQNNDEPRTI